MVEEPSVGHAIVEEINAMVGLEQDNAYILMMNHGSVSRWQFPIVGHLSFFFFWVYDVNNHVTLVRIRF